MFLRTKSRSIASPRAKDSVGMLAEVSMSTVTASFCTRIAAHGAASAITKAANTAHFSARQTREDPGALRIHHHRPGNSKSKYNNLA